jgi:hypothetical protein
VQVLVGDPEQLGPPIALREPWLGPVTIAKVRGLLPGSEPESVIGSAVFSLVVGLWGFAVGGFPLPTVIVHDMLTVSAVPPAESLMFAVNVTGPLVVGVPVIAPVLALSNSGVGNVPGPME